ncbi:hypothetical protein [Thalassolituus sp.]|jgi:hypothetical protein|uniref:hypothetical protein n=1 Tax=Thalassolituus sp. TaxID=2030822 RepID=UPI0032D924F6
MYKKLALALTMSTAIAGCGGGSSSSSSAPAAGIEVSGTAEAPGGVIAQYKQESPFQIALNFVFTPAAAALSGLQPVTGATVELIRVDANGAQIGEVLATTSTSITGDYTLTLPTGVDLSGDLIVRITGTNNKELRAQVVEQDVDINPISEYILRSFVESGTDLTIIEPGEVVKLSNKLEEFDLVASGSVDIDGILSQLESELGDFVDNQIGSITQPAVESSVVAALAGAYRTTGLNVGLHDDDGQYGSGTFGTDLYNTDFTFADGGDGTIDITINSEEDAFSNFQKSGSGYSLYYATDIDNESESFSTVLKANGSASIESPFEEDIDGDFGWRRPPTTYNLQKVSDKNIFTIASNEASVRYRTIDTNEDNVKDAIDPDQREGDEIMRSLEVFAKKPSGMTASDLDGDFGRVYMGIMADSAGNLAIENEYNILSFDGAGNLDSGAANLQSLERIANETSSYASSAPAEELDLAVVVTADGDITSIGGEANDGFVNDTFDLLVFGESDGTNTANAEYSKTIAVKLPTTQLNVSGKTYRVQLLDIGMYGGSVSLASFGFNSVIEMASATTGTLKATESYVEKDGTLTAEVTVERNDLERAVTVAVGSNGFTTVTVPDNDSSWVLKGWMNATGSMGVFTTSYQDAQVDPDSLGLAILVDITE